MTICRLYEEYAGDEAVTKQQRSGDRVDAITGRRIGSGETPTRWFATYASGLTRWNEAAAFPTSLLVEFEDAHPDKDDVAVKRALEVEEGPRKRVRLDEAKVEELATRS